MIEAWVEVSEVKEPISQPAQWNISAQLHIGFIIDSLQAPTKGVLKLEIVSVGGGILHVSGLRIPRDLAMRFGAAGLRYNLNDAPASVTVLWLEATGLYLHFLYEREVNAGSQSAIGARPNTEAAEGWVVDGNAIRDIGILESAGAGNRRVVAAGLNAVDRAGAQIEKIGYTTLNGNILKESVGDIRGDSRRGSVHRDGGGADFHGLGNLAGFEDDFDAGGLVDLHLGALHAGDLEAGLLHLN